MRRGSGIGLASFFVGVRFVLCAGDGCAWRNGMGALRLGGGDLSPMQPLAGGTPVMLWYAWVGSCSLWRACAAAVAAQRSTNSVRLSVAACGGQGK